MDNSFRNMGFASNSSLNQFKNMGNSTWTGAMGGKQVMDTALTLNSPAFEYSQFQFPWPRGVKRKSTLVIGSTGRQVGSSLSLGLGRSSSSSDSKGSTATAYTMSSVKENEEESSMDLELDFTLHIANESAPNTKRVGGSTSIRTLELQPIDLELSLSSGPTDSGTTSTHQTMFPFAFIGVPNGEDGISSVNRDASQVLLKQVPPMKINLDSKVNEKHPSSIITLKSSVTCTFGTVTPNKPCNRIISRTCQVEGCGKGARGASGRCISHGGGRRCQKPGCHKGAEGRTIYCKAHGGGRRCEFLGCTKSAEGRTDFCIAHGGGRRCSYEGGCTRAARGKSGLCIRHGGGKRCQMDGCTRSAEGLSGLCISHGGGRRCQFIGCTKGAQGSTVFCKAHGGGKRCTYTGCPKGAEGSTPFCKAHGGGKRCSFHGGGVCSKSVHGGTNFCVAHGGGKRCAVPECTKSARGRTDFCVRHGGGKRCKFYGCGKSAQGSTDFCKAHGGGKRCLWGHPGSDHGAHASTPCLFFARGKRGLCSLHGGEAVKDRRVHGVVSAGLVVLGKDMNIDVQETSYLKSHSDSKEYCHDYSKLHVDEALPSASVLVPEGRVHGGSLMALLAGGLALGGKQ
ncbi:hypothetical protein SAY87_031959 [Trapa incisa]|uniref:WRKY19-like zinc finger domain-containing protein n=1 Tax=Trapa incisa TaxID=236973 RepID=A0AAN7KYP3_9MYRT|nr:hypothetical protein SAY87_031959 [Trapa incisa]